MKANDVGKYKNARNLMLNKKLKKINNAEFEN